MAFPENFIWGISNSGFQFEMGNPSKKGLDQKTDWFTWTHHKENIEKRVVSGDFPEEGVDYWNLYRHDHAIAESLGLNGFRIGLEWSRIFPENTSSIEVGVIRSSDNHISKIEIDDTILQKLDEKANKEAVNHYRDIILDLKAREFEVFVCLNHFTLPLWIHNPIITLGMRLRNAPKGWIDESTIIEFTKYVAYIAWKLGDVVDNWARSMNRWLFLKLDI